MKIVPDFEDDKYCSHMFYQMSREKAKLKFGIVFVSGKNIHILVFLTENCSVTVRGLPFFYLIQKYS